MSIINTILLDANSSSMLNMLLLPAMFLVMYFFLLRPQMKKQKQEKAFSAGVKVGDKIVTKGGIHGKITRMDEGSTTITLQIDKNTNIVLERAFISMDMSNAIYGPEVESKS